MFCGAVICNCIGVGGKCRQYFYIELRIAKGAEMHELQLTLAEEEHFGLTRNDLARSLQGQSLDERERIPYF